MKPEDSIDDDDTLQGLIADFLDALNRCEQVDRDALLEKHPEYADSLLQFFSDHDRMASAASIDDPVDLDLPTLPQNPNADEQPTIPMVSPVGDGGQEFETSPEPVGQNHASVGDQVRYFGDYELLSEIARGGMGVVYKARQVNLNRLVALKMILSGQLASEEDVTRFYLEAEAAANLDHPGIVPIYEIGQHEGQHFFAMGFIEGQSLQQRIQDGPLPPREAAELTLKVAEAIQYAHEKGVIHRDLKPANILLDSKGEPKVTDFGLARKLEQDSGLTKTGAVMGTPSYMPPEQASGKTDEVGPLADVYSLGAILYCLLTGRPPFQAANPLDTLLQVLEKEPVPPLELIPNVPRDLNTIVLKCLEKAQGRRYASALNFVEDLKRFLNDEPILARSVSRSERAWRWCKRKPAVAVAISLAAVLLGVLTIGGPTVAWQQSTLRAKAIKEREISRHFRYASDMSLIKRDWEANKLELVWDTLTQHLPEEGRTDLRGFEWYYYASLLNAGSETIQLDEEIKGIVTIPNGAFIAAIGTERLTILNSKTLEVLSTQTQRNMVHPGCVLSPDGKTLFRLERDWKNNQMLLIQQDLTADTATISSLDCSGASIPAINKKGNRLALVCPVTKDVNSHNASSNPFEVQIYDLPRCKKIGVLQREDLPPIPLNLKFHPINENLLLVGGGASGDVGSDSVAFTIQLVNIISGEVVTSLQGHSDVVTGLEFSLDGSLVISSSRDKTVCVWDVATGDLLHTLDGFDSHIWGTAIDASGSLIAVAMLESIAVFNSATGDEVCRLLGGKRFVSFDTEKGQLISGGLGGTLKIWDLKTQIKAGRSDSNFNLNFSRLPLFIASFSASMSHAFGLDSSGTAQLINLESNNVLFEQENGVFIVSKDARHIGVTVLDDRRRTNIKVIRSSDGTVVRKLPYEIFCGFDSTGSRVFGRVGNRILVDDLNDSKQLAFPAISSSKASISRNDELLAITGSAEGNATIDVYGMSSGNLKFSTRVDGELTALELSETFMASADEKSVRVWKLDSGLETHGIIGHDRPVVTVKISPNERRLLTADTGGVLKLWDLISGREVLELNHPEGILAAGFTPNGQTMRALGREGTVMTWNAPNS